METLPVLRSVCFPCLSKFRGDGAGISIAHCHALVDGFSSVGFHKAFARNICVEVLPGDVDTVQFNERLVLESAGKLPGLHAVCVDQWIAHKCVPSLHQSGGGS